ncbi:biopolymer transporter ExbD [Candidatus Persebacteraceae bacterium Df01]|uniref:Biopolymer transporter ExbD n=1 Tax=Candidatus Doriopsillibacter californiensis TaxID=2970740 RepID=A0ABT7QJJ0_9GAMM|nr:biopolymer transporter ExbD [Candidatus Persebacteraceae bacterium Df01]
MSKRLAPISNINVVPYLDVMLVLLVIFMITTPLFNQGVVELPSVGDAPLSEQKPEAVEIIYSEATVNPYRIIDRANDEETAQLNITELLDLLNQKKLLHPDKPIIISAAEKLEYKNVMALLGKLQHEGFNQVGLVAKNSDGN